jgi:hypothetical protein
MCAQLEAIGKEGTTVEGDDLLRRIEVEYERVREALKNVRTELEHE